MNSTDHGRLAQDQVITELILRVAGVFTQMGINNLFSDGEETFWPELENDLRQIRERMVDLRLPVPSGDRQLVVDVILPLWDEMVRRRL